MTETPALRLSALKTKVVSGRYDRWLLIGGGLFIPLGLVLIVLGWAGAAQTPLLQEQVPYLISGGMLGVALLSVGGFAYFAYLLSVLIRDGRARERQQAGRDDAMIARLERLESLLGVIAHNGVRTAKSTSNHKLVATPTGTMIHRPDCPVVAGRDGVRAVTWSEGLRPCSICQPAAGDKKLIATD